jgi:protein SCO1
VALGDERSSVRVLAVSVDPTGDTPERVRSYAAIHRLRPEFHYLIGSRRELEPVWRDYDVQAFAADPENELVEHTAQTLLVDPEGMVQLVYPANATADAVLHDVRLFLQE